MTFGSETGNHQLLLRTSYYVRWAWHTLNTRSRSFTFVLHAIYKASFTINISMLRCSNMIYFDHNYNAIRYVTGNFIGQLHLRVRVNFTFYLVGHVDLK
jgi:hypothetical protein